MQKTKRRILALLLVAALTVTQLPATALANNAGQPVRDSGANGEGGEIIAFDTLPEETANQTVALGASLEDLNLPNTLNATVGVVTAEDTEAREPEADEGQSEPEPKTMEINIPIPVEWVSSPDYDGEKAGTYTFTAQIEGFKVSAVLPSISVTVNEITGTVTAFEKLPGEIRWQNTAAPTFPETVGGTVNGEAVQIPVTWRTEQDYDENAPERGLYVFDAVMGEGYTLAGGAIAPRITVYIPETISRFAPFRMGGSGTGASPLEITTAAQLAEIAELVNAGRLETFLFNDSAVTVYLEMKNDLDLSVYGQGYNSGKGWKSIGTAVNPFKGRFDGGGNTIAGLYINDTALSNAGLFGAVEGGMVQKVLLSDASVRGLTTGGIVGQIKNATVEKCGVTGSVNGSSKVGGVVGVLLENASVKNSYSIGNVSGTGNQVGGIAGQLFYSTATVQNCYSTAAVKGNMYVGGIAGDIANGTDMVKDCAALGPSISAAAYKGRVAGQNFVLSGNVAFSGMTGGTFNNDPYGLNGADITADAIKADGTIGGRFTTANGWTVEKGKLPGFGSAVDMPAHIIDIPAGKHFPGEGTSDNPYQISTAAQLAKLAELVNGSDTNSIYGWMEVHYILTDDIDLSGYGEKWNDTMGWVPIGNAAYCFRGDFNGGGKTITGLYINDANLVKAGLFGDSMGSIHDLHLEGVRITAKEKVGGIAGYLSYHAAKIERCSVSGIVTGQYDVGGIIGFTGGAIAHCFSTCNVTGEWQVGGVAGQASRDGGETGGDILGCYATGTVIGTKSNIGGVAGRLINGTMKNCVALNPKVIGAGRVVGYNYGTLSGNVAFSDMTGGGNDKTASGLDGADISADQLQATENWPAVFKADPWTLTNGFLPGLFGKTVEMPMHITDKLTSYFAGGDGSESKPYQISTAAQLAKLAELVNSDDEAIRNAYNSKYYKLMNSLDLTGYGVSNAAFNEGMGWIPIGNNINNFSGQFDGNYKTITGLYINNPDREHAGLFGYINYGSVKNLGIVNANITAKGYIGGVAGLAYGDTSSGVVEGCYVSGSMSGSKWHIGGVVGQLYSTMKNCYSTASVKGKAMNAGGVVGRADYGSTVQNCYSTGAITGLFDYSGGIAGNVDNKGKIQSCAALNPSINGGGGVVGRVVGNNQTGSTLVGNRAFSGMIGGGNNKTADGLDGADMTAEQINTADFWTTDTNWDSAATWSNLAWNFQDGYLPLLNGFDPGAQSGNGGLYLTERDIGNATVNVGGPYTYTGSAIEPSLTVTFDGVALAKDTDYTVSCSNNTNAGTATVTLTGKGNFKGTKTATYTIDKKVPTATDLTYYLTAKTYNGLAQPLSVTANAELGAITVKYNGSSTEPKDAKTYAVTVSIAEGTNYAATTADIALGDYTINKAKLTVTGIAAKTYDGTTDTSGLALTFSGLQNSEELTPDTDYAVTGAFDSADVGANKTVTGTIVLADNATTANYTLASASLNLTNQTIGKATTSGNNQTLKAYKNYAHDYDFDLTTLLPTLGSPKSLGAVEYAIKETANSDSVLGTLNYATGNTLTIPVQSVSAAGKTATITVTVKSTNYADFDATITVNTIDPILLTITGTVVNTKIYDGNTAATLYKTPILVTTNVQSGDEVTLVGTPSAVFDNANAGTNKNVIITGLSLAGKDAAKYSLDLSGVTGEITAKLLANSMVTLSGSSFTYTGMAHTPDVTVKDGSTTLVKGTDYTVTYANNTNAGIATVTVTGMGNYSGAVSKNFTIEKATPAALTWPNASAITYGAALSASNLTGGSATGTWAWTNGTIIPPAGSGSYEVTFTPKDAQNYDWSGVTLRQNVSITVNKASGLTVLTQPSMSAKEGVARSYEFNMDNIALKEVDTGAKTYSAIEGMDTNNILSNIQVNGSKLTYAISNTAAVGNTATVTITISTANYEDATATLTITVTAKDTQTIGFEDAAVTKTYGDAKFTQTATQKSGSGTGQITYASDNTTVATVNAVTGEVTIVGAGSANITATKAADDDWRAATAAYGLTVNKKTVTITAHDKTAKVGQSQPAYTYGLTGLIPGESLTTEPTVTCPTADMSTAGTYPIVPGGATASANYAIQYQNGTLTVSALSPACDVVGITSPAGSTINGASITATVANSVSSQLVGVTVSADAAWALYSDASCTSEITSKTMTLSVGANTAYIKVTAEDGITAKIYTVTITRSASTGGGGSGGGSGSGGSSSGRDTTTTGPEKQPGQPTTATVPVTVTTGANGVADAVIPDKVIADAIAKAQAEAKKQGKTANGIGVFLDVHMPQGASSLSLTLSQAALQSLTSANAQSLEISGGIASLNLDLEALKEIQRQSMDSVTITIKPVQNLSAAAQKLIGTRPVYDVTISYVKDGKTVNITSLGKGSATLSFPYTPGNNEAVGYLFGVYVDGKGNATRIPGSAYDANSRSIIFPAGHFSVYGVGYTAPTEKYTDIANHWAKESIDYAVGRGLFSGTGDTRFSPDIAMDRGMLVTVLGRLTGADVSACQTSSFSDVATGQYYLPYIEWAYKKGIISGTGGGKFAPERGVTREEIALILENYAKATGYKLPVTREEVAYADAASIGNVYQTAVTAMQQAGIMVGGSDNKFNPKTGATRAEVAAMLHRYIKLAIDPATAQGWVKNNA